MPAKHPKRPRDLNQWAKRMVDLATGQRSDADPAGPKKDPSAVERGRLGGLKGGKARAEKMTVSEHKPVPSKRSSPVGRAARLLSGLFPLRFCRVFQCSLRGSGAGSAAGASDLILKLRFGYHSLRPQVPRSTLTTSPMSMKRRVSTEPIVLAGSREFIANPPSLKRAANSGLRRGFRLEAKSFLAASHDGHAKQIAVCRTHSVSERLRGPH